MPGNRDDAFERVAEDVMAAAMTRQYPAFPFKA